MSYSKSNSIVIPPSADAKNDDLDGKLSDHLMVVMSPVSVINNRPARVVRSVTYRPFNGERLQQMENWINSEDWAEILQEKDANKQMTVLQQLLVSKYYFFFPTKTKKISSDDEPYFNEKLKLMKRRKCRENNKHRRSTKWNRLQSEFDIQLEKAKFEFYSRKISKLRKTKPKQWHRELKKLSSFDQNEGEEAEVIAEKFAEIS